MLLIPLDVKGEAISNLCRRSNPAREILSRTGLNNGQSTLKNSIITNLRNNITKEIFGKFNNLDLYQRRCGKDSVKSLLFIMVNNNGAIFTSSRLR